MLARPITTSFGHLSVFIKPQKREGVTELWHGPTKINHHENETAQHMPGPGNEISQSGPSAVTHRMSAALVAPSCRWRSNKPRLKLKLRQTTTTTMHLRMTSKRRNELMAGDHRLSPRTVVWRQLHWSQPLGAENAIAFMRALLADQVSPRLVLEVRSGAGGVVYLLGGVLPAVLSAQAKLKTTMPETRITELHEGRLAPTTVRRVKLSTLHRPLRTDQPEQAARMILGSLSQVRKDEVLILQLTLGPRRIPLSVPNNSLSSVVMPWWQILCLGHGDQVDGEKRTALKSKVSDHGCAATVRLGVIAHAPTRRKELLTGLFSALRTLEAPGVQLRLMFDRPKYLHEVRQPLFWSLRLNASELLVLSGMPVGDEPLPGRPPLHPKALPPVDGTTGSTRIVAMATTPGTDTALCLPAPAALHHLHVLGPTGTGKSTLLTSLIAQDMANGKAVVVIDPQGDLVEDALARVPASRQSDVIVLDPSDTMCPVGLNPLLTRGRNPEVVADGLLAVFKGLYGDALGPRSQDILHACLLTLTGSTDASLVMLPLLLTNAGFRRSVTSKVHDPIALGPFWEWYEHLSEAERQAATAPIQNKLRQWLLRPSLRNVLAQRTPKLSMSEVFQDKKILLVSLAQGMLGPEGAALLGSLVIAQLWQATTERVRLAKSQRPPVMVYLDEFSAFLHLPTDLADALARSRGMGISYTLAHQFLSQLSPGMRSSVLANTRSRVCFQLAPEDAVVIARNHPEVSAEDLTALGRYEVYASLFARGQTSPFASGRTLPPPPVLSDPAQLRAASRQRHGMDVRSIEREFKDLFSLGPATRDPGSIDSTRLGKARRRSS